METQHNRKPAFTLPFLALTVLFVVCLIIANLVEIKTVSLGFMTVTAGLAVFPVSYIINDCIVEVYGFRKARFVIWLGFAMSLFVALMLNIAIWLPGGADWHNQEAMVAIYSSVPRIMFASFAAFICGSMVNAYVMSRMKRTAAAAKNDSVMRLSLRAVVSTLWGEGVDSVIFFPIAFAGTLPAATIVNLIITQALLKTAYEIIVLPVTVKVVKRLKRMEHIDTVDSLSTNYSWWRLTDL
jgi:uncharacterized integral membrane protein (TIGR00697 family)